MQVLQEQKPVATIQQRYLGLSVIYRKSLLSCYLTIGYVNHNQAVPDRARHDEIR
jgi:hypothetical protein